MGDDVRGALERLVDAIGGDMDEILSAVDAAREALAAAPVVDVTALPDAHPKWSDDTPVLLGQRVAFTGSDADDERYWEEFVGTVVRIEGNEVAAWYDNNELEAILTPGTYFRPSDELDARAAAGGA